MKTIPLYRVQLALGIVADSLREHPFCVYGPVPQRARYAISNNTTPRDEFGFRLDQPILAREFTRANGKSLLPTQVAMRLRAMLGRPITAEELASLRSPAPHCP